MATRSSASVRSRNSSASGSSSGLNLSRAQEKEQLETGNNRLAVYIDTVRRLEQDNRELKVKFLCLFCNKKKSQFLQSRVSLHHIVIRTKSKHRKSNNYTNVNLKMQRN